VRTFLFPADRAPDSLEPVVGWRAWDLVHVDHDCWRLDSVIHRCVWPVRHELVAACLTTRGHVAKTHFSPIDRCQCGIYATASLDRLANYVGQGLGPSPRLQAIGLVSLWGRLLQHEQGWRGSHGYPRRLWLPQRNSRDEPIGGWETIALDLADYGAPILPLDRGTSPAILATLREWETEQAWPPVSRVPG
jgi:hypothetical protein